jgi:hypothetical protein
MKILSILLIAVSMLFSYGDGIKIIYKSEVPTDKSDLIYYKKMGNNQLERSEKILKDAEKEVIKFAKERHADIIEIYVINKENGEIITESQQGRIGFVEILFSLRNNR